MITEFARRTYGYVKPSPAGKVARRRGSPKRRMSFGDSRVAVTDEEKQKLYRTHRREINPRPTISNIVCNTQQNNHYNIIAHAKEILL